MNVRHDVTVSSFVFLFFFFSFADWSPSLAPVTLHCHLTFLLHIVSPLCHALPCRVTSPSLLFMAEPCSSTTVMCSTTSRHLVRTCVGTVIGSPCLCCALLLLNVRCIQVHFVFLSFFSFTNSPSLTCTPSCSLFCHTSTLSCSPLATCHASHVPITTCCHFASLPMLCHPGLALPSLQAPLLLCITPVTLGLHHALPPHHALPLVTHCLSCCLDVVMLG